MRVGTVAAGLTAALMTMAWAQAPAAAILPAGSHIQAELKTALDSSRLRLNQPVEAQVTSDVKLDGKTMLPKGAILQGTVTEVVKAESKKSPAHIAIRFDTVAFKHRPSQPLRAAIIAVTPPAPLTSALPSVMGNPDMPMQMPNADGAQPEAPGLGPQGRQLGPANDQGTGTQSTLGEQPVPAVVTGSNGEIASLSRASNGAALEIVAPGSDSPGPHANLGSVLTSPHGDISLESGTHILLQVIN